MPPFWSFIRRRLTPTASRRVHLLYSPGVALTLFSLVALFIMREGADINPFKIVDFDVFVFGLSMFPLGIFMAWWNFLKNSRSLFFPTLDLFHERLFQEDPDNPIRTP